ncbi:hypothetical protein [Pseudoalteromonas sp. S4741]|uniref:hypothetical protein n=1 Tax=Pseudoalteromonas sp. S4741 TaxID=579563 RepID=UPI001485C8FA|nr:hypothetical protein [Pseudoalteromonas sp. S4741]
MRTPLLALLLPLCLTACLETTSNETEQTKTNAVKNTSTPIPQQKLPQANRENKIAQQLPVDAAKEVSLDDIKTAKNKLNNLIADKQCSTSSQCKVSAVGSRACGGPSDYIVYSTQSAPQEQVSALSDTITQLESTYNVQKGMMSICQHLTAPSTQCVENKCVKLEGSAVSVF